MCCRRVLTPPLSPRRSRRPPCAAPPPQKPAYNKWLALFGNLPLVVPVAVKFREYHHDHHIFLVGAGRVPAGCWAGGWVQ